MFIIELLINDNYINSIMEIIFMNKLGIVFSKFRDRKTEWSGTKYQLMLQMKKYFNIVELVFNLNIFQYILLKFLKIIKQNHLATTCLLNWERHFIYKKHTNNPILMFNSSYPEHRSFIYLDCTYSFLLFLAKNDYTKYKYSLFDYSINGLEKLQMLQDIYFEKCGFIFIMSQWLYSFFMEHYDNLKHKFFYVGGGNNLDLTKICLNNKADDFLFVGKDFYRKSGDLVVEAFEKIQDKVPNSKLYIVGVENKTNKNNRIVYLGELSYEETQEYFNKCRVFVMPSRFEAYGMAFAEALMSGNIIIGRDDFELHYFINEDNGYFVDLNSDDIAEKMLTAMNNKELTKKIISDNKKYIEKYSWDTVGKRIIDIIEKNN